MAKTELFHGADGGKIIKILDSGKMLPDAQGELYFDYGNFTNCFMHGADSERKKAFVLKVEIDIENLHCIRTQKPGNPTTLIVKTILPISVKVLEMYIRSRPEEEEEGFSIRKVVGEADIRAEL